MKDRRAQELYREASRFLVSGVGAGGRFFKAIGRPVYVERADGAYLYDVDGNRLIDYHMSSGAALLGHNHSGVRRAIEKSLELGCFCNYDSEHHYRLAQSICAAVPSAEKVRFANSGTEATMGALRLARSVTGRKKILKFEGHFHGMHELVWFNGHTDPAPSGPGGELPVVPDSAGIPEELGAVVVVVPFNDPEAFVSCLRRHRGEVAAVILEPVMYNAGCILPRPGFLELVREETAREGIVLIFDEVLSGFRMCLGGAQEYLGITPDLCTLAKALGGTGVPIAALAGKDWIMKDLNPAGKTVMSGTYPGHLLEVLSALEALRVMKEPGFYGRLNGLGERLYRGLVEILVRRNIKAVVQGVGARFAIYFGLERTPLYDYREVAARYDFDANRRFVAAALGKGLYLQDYGNRHTPTHHGFSAAHSEADIDQTLAICDELFTGWQP